MPPIIDVKGPPEPGVPKEPFLKRLGWFAFYWTCGLLATTITAYGLKALLR